MPTLGFVGLGAMGGRMAKRLLAAGHPVTDYNRSGARAQWPVDAGVRPGAGYMEMSTVKPTATCALGADVAAPRGNLLSASL